MRYVHYSLMVFGHARIPRSSAGCATKYGGHELRLDGWRARNHAWRPSFAEDGKLVESYKHDIIQILQESLEHEQATLNEYYTCSRSSLTRACGLRNTPANRSAR